MTSTRRDCPYCKRPYTEAEYEARKAERRQNALNSRAKAAANGNPVKRKLKLSSTRAKALLTAGFKPKQIAEMSGVSLSLVHKKLKGTE